MFCGYFNRKTFYFNSTFLNEKIAVEINSCLDIIVQILSFEHSTQDFSKCEEKREVIFDCSSTSK